VAPHVDSENSFIAVVWQGECCIDSVSGRLDELVRAVSDGRTVQIDARDVTRIDTAGIQLLLALSLELQRRGRALVWLGISEVVEQVARLTGLRDALGLHPT
jgi:phospholipid transport system transporter-binding protein